MALYWPQNEIYYLDTSKSWRWPVCLEEPELVCQSCHPGAGQIIDMRIKLNVFWVLLELLRSVSCPLSRNTLVLLFALLLIEACGLQTTRERCQVPRGDGGVIAAVTGL